jgi:hypothetical protein
VAQAARCRCGHYEAGHRAHPGGGCVVCECSAFQGQPAERPVPWLLVVLAVVLAVAAVLAVAVAFTSQAKI